MEPLSQSLSPSPLSLSHTHVPSAPHHPSVLYALKSLSFVHVVLLPRELLLLLVNFCHPSEGSSSVTSSVTQPPTLTPLCPSSTNRVSRVRLWAPQPPGSVGGLFTAHLPTSATDEGHPRGTPRQPAGAQMWLGSPQTYGPRACPWGGLQHRHEDLLVGHSIAPCWAHGVQTESYWLNTFSKFIYF